MKLIEALFFISLLVLVACSSVPTNAPESSREPAQTQIGDFSNSSPIAASRSRQTKDDNFFKPVPSFDRIAMSNHLDEIGFRGEMKGTILRQLGQGNRVYANLEQDCYVAFIREERNSVNMKSIEVYSKFRVIWMKYLKYENNLGLHTYRGLAGRDDTYAVTVTSKNEVYARSKSGVICQYAPEIRF